jgi:hypothetical protein
VVCVARWLERQGYYRLMSACARGWARVSEMISLYWNSFKYIELNCTHSLFFIIVVNFLNYV